MICSRLAGAKWLAYLRIFRFLVGLRASMTSVLSVASSMRRRRQDARQRGIAKDPAAVAELMTAVGGNFNRGLRIYDELVEAMKASA